MKTVIEGQHYRLGERCLVAHRNERGYWVLYPLDHPEEPEFIVNRGILLCPPLLRVDPESRYIVEDLEEIWSLEEVVAVRE